MREWMNKGMNEWTNEWVILIITKTCFEIGNISIQIYLKYKTKKYIPKQKYTEQNVSI